MWSIPSHPFCILHDAPLLRVIQRRCIAALGKDGRKEAGSAPLWVSHVVAASRSPSTWAEWRCGPWGQQSSCPPASAPFHLPSATAGGFAALVSLQCHTVDSLQVSFLKAKGHPEMPPLLVERAGAVCIGLKVNFRLKNTFQSPTDVLSVSISTRFFRFYFIIFRKMMNF